MFIDILDTTIVNVALPDLGREFHASTTSIEWIVLGYLLSLAVWIPASGWIGDRIGTRRVFLFALAMFTAASALCGQANSLGELVAFRVLQGVGGGMLVPVGTAMLFRAFPPIERAKASTVLILPTVIAPALGPVLGGYLVTDVSWRWIFYVNLPVGIVAFAIGFLYLRENREGAAGRFDVRGFVLSGGGLALLLFALSQGPEKGWRSLEVIVSSQIVGRLYHRVGPRRLIFFGMLGMTAATYPLSRLGLDTSLWTIRFIMFGRGLAASFSFVPLQAATYANVTPADTGRA